MLIVRRETKNDFDSVDAIVTAAFGRSDEAELVKALRSVDEVISLVAIKDMEWVGHIMFSPITLIDADNKPSSLKLTALAPMAVRPEYQKDGIGKAMIWEGLEQCRRMRFEACFVLGHTDYYPRFGFKPAQSTYNINSTYDVPDPVFMGLELVADVLKDSAGTIHYNPVFQGL